MCDKVLLCVNLLVSMCVVDLVVVWIGVVKVGE